MAQFHRRRPFFIFCQDERRRGDGDKLSDVTRIVFGVTCSSSSAKNTRLCYHPLSASEQIPRKRCLKIHYDAEEEEARGSYPSENRRKTRCKDRMTEDMNTLGNKIPSEVLRKLLFLAKPAVLLGLPPKNQKFKNIRTRRVWSSSMHATICQMPPTSSSSLNSAAAVVLLPAITASSFSAAHRCLRLDPKLSPYSREPLGCEDEASRAELSFLDDAKLSPKVTQFVHHHASSSL
ncbi:hypothetical protein RB195_021561 [Necator americanus]|uniref:Uncharacterized protein n=1 Tax=Necator americanus TaxID=51031 RepID=A0ABR1EBU1_NECAM